jgi:hypothetical protein
MSHDLVFWRQKSDAILNARSVYETLMEGNDVVGLEPLDEKRLVASFLARFPSAERTAGCAQMTWSDVNESRSVNVEWSATHFVAMCSWHMTNEELHAVIDVGVELGCPLYDPQIDQRFA